MKGTNGRIPSRNETPHSYKLSILPEHCTLISSDVSALYPSIPHVEGFKAMSDFLKDRTKYDSQQRTSILKALEIVITENYISWNRNTYKQIKGVAMGTPVAVAYANIFMNWEDREIKQQALYIHEHIRYIDDNLYILPNNKINEIMQTANNILPLHTKFTYKKIDPKAEAGLLFLDTQLLISEEGNIQSRLFTKKTDRHAYLLPTSFHPPYITQNIPATVFSRIRKICSREEWFEADAEEAGDIILRKLGKR